VINLAHRAVAKATYPLDEHVSIEGHDLRNIRNGVSREIGFLSLDQYVPRGIEQPQVGCQDHRDGRANPASIERVGLHDEYRTAEPWFGTGRLQALITPDPKQG